jgi:alanine racemase
MLRAVARVNVAAIERNAARLAAGLRPSTTLAAVVKADGYGHGAAPAARAALAGGATWLGVATAQEAAGLRAAGLEARILVMGALSPEELEVALDADADVVAWSRPFAEGLAGRGARAHVKLDTGMGRLGTRDPAEATALADTLAAAEGVALAGLMTHFATADERGDAFLGEQLDRFRAWALPLRDRHPRVILHAANSAATLREPATHLDLVRPGLALYGLDPFQEDAGARGLEPALKLVSYLAAVKPAAPGQSVGYGRRWTATRPTTVATIPIGYGDGVRRGLTNNAEVSVGGRRVPLVGTVSMDNVTVDLGPQDKGGGARVGDEAVLIGAGITAEEIAHRLDTITYEVVCGISARVPRVHHRDGAPA